MNKNRIRLTESQLHNVISESVKSVLMEGSGYEQEESYPQEVVMLAKQIQKLGYLWHTKAMRYEKQFDGINEIDEDLNAICGDLNAYSMCPHWDSGINLV